MSLEVLALEAERVGEPELAYDWLAVDLAVEVQLQDVVVLVMAGREVRPVEEVLPFAFHVQRQLIQVLMPSFLLNIDTP